MKKEDKIMNAVEQRKDSETMDKIFSFIIPLMKKSIQKSENPKIRLMTSQNTGLLGCNGQEQEITDGKSQELSNES